MDLGAARFAAVVREALGIDAADIPGAGAAGGLGYALLVFLRARMASGISLILDMVGFDERAARADVVITGEGRMDGQTVMGPRSPPAWRRPPSAAGHWWRPWPAA